MKKPFIFPLLMLLLAPIRVDLPLIPSEAGAQTEVIEEDMTERWKDLKVLRDPFLDPEWLKKKRIEEERKRTQEKRSREAGRRKRALKLKGIIQVDQRFVAIVDGKTLRPGDVIRGRKVLEVNRAGIRVLYKGKVKHIFLETQKQSRRLR